MARIQVRVDRLATSLSRSVRGGRRAAAAVEFALIATIFLGITAFLADLGFVLYTQVALDFVGSRASRMLAVDTQQSLSANQAAFQAIAVCPLLAAFLGCDDVSVQLTPVTEYSASGAASGDPGAGTGAFSAGQGGSLMLLQLSYRLPTFAIPLAMPGVFASTTTVIRFPFINEY